MFSLNSFLITDEPFEKKNWGNEKNKCSKYNKHWKFITAKELIYGLHVPEQSHVNIKLRSYRLSKHNLSVERSSVLSLMVEAVWSKIFVKKE